MNKKYVVRLTEEERGVCAEVVKKLKGTSQKVRRAQILLQADADGPAWIDAKICEAYYCRVETVEQLRKRFVTQGFEVALHGQPRTTSPTPKLLNGEQEAKLIAMRLGKAAGGVRTLDVALARRSDGGVGDRGDDQPRDGPADA